MSDIQQNIQNSLDEIERKEHVKILHCVESGAVPGDLPLRTATMMCGLFICGSAMPI